MDTTQQPQEMAQDQVAQDLSAENNVPETLDAPKAEEQFKNAGEASDSELPQAPAPAESEELFAEEKTSENA